MAIKSNRTTPAIDWTRTQPTTDKQRRPPLAAPQGYTPNTSPTATPPAQRPVGTLPTGRETDRRLPSQPSIYSRYEGDARQYVNDTLFPYWQRARDDMRANLVDQGMLSSSAGLQRYSQDVEQPYAQAANSMYRDYINQRTNEEFSRNMAQRQEDRAQQQEDRAAQNQTWSQQFQTGQANSQNAQNLYNLLWSAYLNMYGVGGAAEANKLGRPADPDIFKQIQGLSYIQPTSTYSPQNIGDPVPDKYTRIRDAGPSLAEKQADEDNAYRNAYLNYMKSTAGSGGGGSLSDEDKWAQMASDVQANYANALDDTVAGERHPTDLFEWFAGAYGIDLESILKNPNDPNYVRAQKLVRSAYTDPSVAQAVLDRVMGGGTWKKPSATGTTDSGTPTGAFADSVLSGRLQRVDPEYKRQMIAGKSALGDITGFQPDNRSWLQRVWDSIKY